MATASKSTSSSRGGTTKSPAKKSAAKRTTDKKAPANKTAAKKAPADKAPAGRTTAKKPPAMKVARTAAEQLVALTGREPEAVIGIQRGEDGWQVDLEVVESRRIPDSTDILATYRVETDADGDLTGYQRTHRYVRGKGGDSGGGGR